LVIQILKQYSITQPEIVPKLVATFRSPTASFIRPRDVEHVTTIATNIGTISGRVIEYCFSVLRNT